MGKWEMVRLGDVCQFINGDRGKNYPSSDDFVDDGVPFINAGHLQNEKISFENMNYISKSKYDSLGSGKTQQGDLLYCLRGSLGKNAIVNFSKGAIASSLVILRPLKINNRYLLYLLNTNQIYEQQLAANNGSSQPNLSAASVKLFQIPLPPMDIQQKIADTLDISSAALEKRRAQIDKLDLLIQSQFIEMFGDPVTNPKGWEYTTLNNIANIASSKRIFESEYVKNGVPFYRTKEIVELSKGEKIKTELFISNERYSEISKKHSIPRIGDLMISAVGTIGVIWVVNTNSPFYFKDGNILWIRCNDDSNPLFMKYLLSSLVDYSKKDLAAGSSYSALTIAKLKKMKTHKPPIELQNQFASFVQQVEAQKSLLQSSLGKLELNHKSLMQKAFRGELF